MSIKQQWQQKWRQALGEPINPMPDYREDFVLQFDIWNIGDAELANCFSDFPKSDRLLRRVKEVVASVPKNTDVNDEYLLASLDQMNQDIEVVLEQFNDQELIDLNAEKSQIEKRHVYRGTETQRRVVFENADSPMFCLDDELCEIIQKYCGDVGYEAFFFLSEPLYQLGGCDYSVSHWIAWAMVEDEFEVDPYQQAFDFYKIKAQAGWGNGELFVFIES